ncbi:hypothetical protein BSL78_08704 [Apostichopus japonicus]|uniref:EKC/KEOPS complex subunit GON7 n=1 Tax=Stichopus japonicus TaxID=307972 RepID=A0A2G8L298_STIJA|nr:hypothetical protein BSL78_08704 [Apostichopus japonicus]
MAASMLSATLTTKNGNSSQFSQPIADSSKKCSLTMLHKGLINMKEDLNQILTALVESEKNNDGTTDAATNSDGEVSDKEDEDGSDQSDDRNQDKRKSEEEQKGHKKPKVS